ncbi:BREX-1 system adenine-specific DNA-methyltransferase PglX, partial [Methanocrinis sp.]|uniref:BREX-1 system adenine-specific DNA-methyltransferase PglX n=1 Tax=Methanocrinis sp. TaxID=3101522 RepID=UPI003D11589D
MERALIHNVTLGARELLIKEVWDLFRGVYGLDPRGNLEKVENLPALQQVPEAMETRQKLEKYLKDEEKAGQKRAKATEKLAKEVAFTHLNRLVAFKMMEGRKLIRGTIDRHHSSNGFIFYLADHPEEMAMYEGGSLPQNALGEGARDVAYRRFLLNQSAKMAEEIRVLFDPDNLASRLFPRPRALKDLIDMLNDPALEDAWAPDNEETIGWIYQYFTEDEKKAVFDRLYKKKQKIRPEDIPAATQLFTPRWIVKFLVQNTLGRLWVQMHPDSRLVETLDYLVPLAGEIPLVPIKPVREIETLDPACGTMHFGLVAFDLLAEMYREEMARAGEPGWPERPSAESEDEIPAAILANNIFGIDIALRAVQLSALALYLKAKTLNPKAKITESHLACAEIELPKDDRWLEDFFDSRSISNPVYERVVRALWAQIKENSGKGAGSLLPLEEVIGDLVAMEKKRHQSTLQGLEDLAEMDPEAEKIEFWGEDFWPILEDQVVRAFDYYAREHDETFFAGEVTKGMRLLDVMRRRYDAVFTNPPYLARRNMYPLLADFLAAYYPKGKGDLYTAFIDRSASFLKDSGRIGMIAQQSFMFITSYENMRKKLLDCGAIEAMAHVGPHAFEDIGGEKVNTVLFTLMKEPDQEVRNDSIGTYFRLVKEPDSESKRQGFERAVSHLRSNELDSAVFCYQQGNFEVISSSPLVYWISPGMRRQFLELPKLEDIAQPRVGLQTGDNFRFLRFWWEVGAGQIAFGCRS